MTTTADLDAADRYPALRQVADALIALGVDGNQPFPQPVIDLAARLAAAEARADRFEAALRAALPLVSWAVRDVMGDEKEPRFKAVEAKVRAALAGGGE